MTAKMVSENTVLWWNMLTSKIIITACKRSLGQGNVFTHFCQSVYSQSSPKQAVPILLEWILVSFSGYLPLYH